MTNKKTVNVYERSEDLHIRSAVVYFNQGDGDGRLYADPDFSVGITKDVLKDLFIKNMLVVCNPSTMELSRPVFFEEYGNWNEVSYGAGARLRSVEYEPANVE